MKLLSLALMFGFCLSGAEGSEHFHIHAHEHHSHASHSSDEAVDDSASRSDQDSQSPLHCQHSHTSCFSALMPELSDFEFTHGLRSYAVLSSAQNWNPYQDISELLRPPAHS